MATPPKPPESPSTPVSSGPDMDSWQIPGGSSLAPPPSSPPQGFMIASVILASVGGLLFVTSFFPCMGWLDWFGVPINAAAALVGILGMIAGPKKPDGTPAYRSAYLAAIVVGAIGFLSGVLL